MTSMTEDDTEWMGLCRSNSGKYLSYLFETKKRLFESTTLLVIAKHKNCLSRLRFEYFEINSKVTKVNVPLSKLVARRAHMVCCQS